MCANSISIFNLIHMVTFREIYDDSLMNVALSARDCALAKRGRRSRAQPRTDPNTGTKLGGTAWEWGIKGKFDEKKGRCYPFGCTFQRQRSVYSPCTAGKLTVADENTLKMRKDLTEVIAPTSTLISS